MQRLLHIMGMDEIGDRPRRTDDDVGARHFSRELVERHGHPVEAPRGIDRQLEIPRRDHHVLHACADEMPRGELCHLSRAHEQDRLAR